jgi:4-hydroxy-2-oxoheptanedioate aldolase
VRGSSYCDAREQNEPGACYKAGKVCTMKQEIRKNAVKQKILKGETALGLYICIPSPTLVELAGYAGFDFVRIDVSHSAVGPSALEHMIRAAEISGVTPMARVDYDPVLIGHVLEMGIQGIVVPGVASSETAMQVVKAARFHPMGDRGLFSSPRVAKHGYISAHEYAQWSNEEVLLGIQIESKDAVDRLDEILRVEGIDMIHSGRADMAKSLGVTGQRNHPMVLATEQKVFDVAREHGKNISVHLDPTAANLAETIATWRAKGAEAITLGHDITLIKKAFDDAMTAARQARNGKEVSV